MDLRKRPLPLVAIAAVVIGSTSCGSSSPEQEGSAPGNGILLACDFTLSTVEPDGRQKRELRQEAGAARWSADGRKIAVVDLPGTLSIMNSDASGLKRLTGEESADFDWSPNDDEIVAEGQSGLRILTSAGKARKLVETRTGDADPDWSPNGKKIAFSSAAGKLQVVNEDGTGRTRLTTGHSPIWSPDGTRLAFERFGRRSVDARAGTYVQTNHLFVMNEDGTHERMVSSTPVGRTVDVAAWSPDGRLLAYTESSDRPEQLGIFVTDLGNRARTPVDKKPTVVIDLESFEDPSHFTWSPDSRRIAFLGLGRNPGLYIRTLGDGLKFVPACPRSTDGPTAVFDWRDQEKSHR
jgi:Tol biopolymer transport system component